MLGRLHEGNDSRCGGPANSDPKTVSKRCSRLRKVRSGAVSERLTNTNLIRKAGSQETTHDFAATGTHRSSRPYSARTHSEPSSHRRHLVRGQSHPAASRPGLADPWPGIGRAVNDIGR